ncbi:HupE/UreJ family protein [Kaistia soli]|uniref:HupE/UreJ family protein n=1 Tax=Kaistia soli TaxID=446684 RepID=UPI001114D73C
MGVVGPFAVFHGFAHGAEMPENAAGLADAAGFLIATAGLHAVDIGFRSLISKAGSDGHCAWPGHGRSRGRRWAQSSVRPPPKI